MATQLKDVAKQLDIATKELAKEQHDWKVQKGRLQRDKIKLTAEAKHLQGQVDALKHDKLELSGELDLLRLTKDKLKGKNTELEVENHKLESEFQEVTKQLAAVTNELSERKANLDTELEEYALERKQEIKDGILKTNEQLTVVLTELEQRNSELESRKTELSQLNQVYLDEQAEIKRSSEETKQLLADNQEKQVELTDSIEVLKQEVQKLQYQKDQLQISMAKSKTEHNNFLEYEKNARKILDNKDRQLQEKAAEIAQGNQFLKNQRSFLPPM